ncbi:hypothetical protein BV22DRAFT_1051170 [Leucogyrophana mollusca]|uniref:Uncharacterized protein n=1 Tax=Leucogyrophana mollusca TaxID=85980 RepID=A0ACB8B0Q0_9AGAM|nr:hypothetical protein BV22DRAFT_1051170 [Leucogyrophana mollusca]
MSRETASRRRAATACHPAPAGTRPERRRRLGHPVATSAPHKLSSVFSTWYTRVRVPLKRPAQPQQDIPLEQEASTVQAAGLVTNGHATSVNTGNRYALAKSPVPADVPNRSTPPDEQPIVPVSPELPTDPQTRVTSTVQPSVPARPWSRNIRERWFSSTVFQSNRQLPAPRSEWPPPLPEIETNDAAGVPGSGAELPGTTTMTTIRTRSLKIMTQSRITRTQGAWMPSASWSVLGGGGTLLFFAAARISDVNLGPTLARSRVVIQSDQPSGCILRHIKFFTLHS